FIGSNFVKYYLEKHTEDKIIGIDKLTYAGNLENIKEELKNKNFEFIKEDITNTKAMEEVFEKNEIDAVINFAAESHVDRSIHDPQIFLKTNILGTQSLLDAAKKSWYDKEKKQWKEGKKYLQVSTDEVYGALGSTGYFTEKTPLDPHSPYSASKTGADLIVKAYHDTFGMPVNITRCSNNYGPYQFPEKLIPLIINNCLNHKELPIYGDGKQVRDWLYVDDHCKAIDMVLRQGKTGEVYNIGGHNEKENIYIVKTIIKLLKEKTKDEKINENLIKYVQDRPGHDRRYGIDPTKIKEELGWEPETKFEEGIEKTINWYLENEEWMKSVISGEYMEFYEKNYK
ncbi:MAG TPA: dTDP-glucose 4,6-dehydratase, partial [Tepiditoga sp.]|nr:dTDP-glucose 4,6-dehydratase [Tepiditoga sp.]